jgi:hypothetical protein
MIKLTRSDKVLVLTETDFNTILSALQVYDNFLVDSAPYDADEEESTQYETDCNDFQSLDNKMINFIRN